MSLPLREDVSEITYHRKPLPSEIRRGEGATHYRTFSIEEACHPETRIPKRWLKDEEGTRWYR